MRSISLRNAAVLALAALVGVGFSAEDAEAKKKKKQKKTISPLVYETPPQLNYTSVIEAIGIKDAATGERTGRYISVDLYNLPTQQEDGEEPLWEHESHHHGVTVILSKEGQELSRHWLSPRYPDDTPVVLQEHSWVDEIKKNPYDTDKDGVRDGYFDTNAHETIFTPGQYEANFYLDYEETPFYSFPFEVVEIPTRKKKGYFLKGPWNDHIRLRWDSDYLYMGRYFLNTNITNSQYQKFMATLHDSEGNRIARFGYPDSEDSPFEGGGRNTWTYEEQYLYRTEGGELKREHLADGDYEIRSDYDGVKGTYKFSIKDEDIVPAGREALDGGVHAITNEEDVYYFQSVEGTYLK